MLRKDIRYLKVPLTFPLPNRDWYQLPDSKWASREWEPAAKAAAEEARYKWVRV